MVIRYADDLVVLHPERAVVERCQIIISEWLTGFGLELKPGKTRLVHTLHKNESGLVGFDFLGFQIRQYVVGKTKPARSSNGKPPGFKTIIKPSQEAIRRHYLKIRDTINQHLMANQTTLIQRLNPIIRGWSKYYSTVCSRQSYRRLDQCLFVKLRAWAIRRHPTKSGGWRYKRYWHQTEGRIRFSTPDWSHRLSFYEDRLIRRHIKVQGARSPFDGNWVYWSTRLGSHPEASIRVGKLLKKQRGKCLSCGLYFKDGDRLEIDHIIPKRMNGKDAYYNWQLLHRHCHDQKTAGEAVTVCPDKHQIS